MRSLSKLPVSTSCAKPKYHTLFCRKLQTKWSASNTNNLVFWFSITFISYLHSLTFLCHSLLFLSSSPSIFLLLSEEPTLWQITVHWALLPLSLLPVPDVCSAQLLLSGWHICTFSLCVCCQQVVHEAYTRFTEDSLTQSVCEGPSEMTEVTIKVSQPTEVSACCPNLSWDVCPPASSIHQPPLTHQFIGFPG